MGIFCGGENSIVKQPQAGLAYLWPLLRAISPLQSSPQVSLEKTIKNSKGVFHKNDLLVLITPSLDLQLVNTLTGQFSPSRILGLLPDPAEYGGPQGINLQKETLLQAGISASILQKKRPETPARFLWKKTGLGIYGTGHRAGHRYPDAPTLPEQPVMKNFAASRLKPFFDRYWHLMLGLSLLLFVLGTNLDHVRWFYNNPPPAGLIWLGAGLGAAVAFSRFSNLSSLVYLFFSALLIGLQTASRLLPGLNELGGMDFWSFSEFTRLHLQLFNLQFFSEWKGNFHGYFLLCFLFCICGAWLVWAAIRLKRPLAGVIPAGCLLGYENSLSQQDSAALAVFMFFTVLLASAASFREQHDNWEKRNISTPWELGEWPFSALVIAGLVAIFTFTIPYVITEEGRRKIADFLRPDPQNTQFSGHVPDQADPFDEEITANDFNLQDLGNPPSRSSVVVLYLRVNDPPPPGYNPEMLNNTNRRYYLRSAIYTTYTGSGWETEAVPPNKKSGRARSRAQTAGSGDRNSSFPYGKSICCQPAGQLRRRHFSLSRHNRWQPAREGTGQLLHR